MSQPPKQKHVIEQFGRMTLFDTKRTEAIKKAAVIQVPLPEDQGISCTDMNGHSCTIRNTVHRDIYVVIFGNNIMYNEHDVRVEFSDP